MFEVRKELVAWEGGTRKLGEWGVHSPSKFCLYRLISPRFETQKRTLGRGLRPRVDLVYRKHSDYLIDWGINTSQYLV